MHLDSMVELDALLPSQYLGRRSDRVPERRLMAAIVHDAFECIEKHRFATDRHRRRLFEEARAWFLARETDWPYSFECICDTLEIDSAAVRARLGVTNS